MPQRASDQAFIGMILNPVQSLNLSIKFMAFRCQAASVISSAFADPQMALDYQVTALTTISDNRVSNRSLSHMFFLSKRSQGRLVLHQTMVCDGFLGL
jgi:hypothetical protein